MKDPIHAISKHSVLDFCLTFGVAACCTFYLRHGHRAVALAYIGPGSGFAFISSFLTLVVGFFASVLSFLSWPFRMAWRMLRRRKGFRDARVKKAIFLGFDGLDPRLTERLISE